MSHRTTRTTRLALTAVAAMTALAACSAGAGTASSSQSEGPVTLQLASQTNSQPAMDLLIKKFHEAYPDITVQASYAESSQYNSQITTQLASGGAADVFVAFPGTGALPSIQALAASGNLAPLDDLGVSKAVPDALTPLISQGGSVYGWPIGESDYFMIYNKKLFDQLGLHVPKTIDDLVGICSAATAAGKTAIAYGGAGIPTNGIVALSLASAAVYGANPEWTAQRDAGKVDFANDRGWQAALAQLVRLRDSGCFQDGAGGTTTADQFAMLARGDALLTFGHSQFVGLARQAAANNPDFDLQVFPFPADTAADQVVPVAYPTQLVVNSSSQHIDAAKKLIAFAMRDDVASEVAAASGFVSVADAAAGNRPAYQSGVADLLSKGKTVNFPLFSWPDPSVFVDFSTNVQGLVIGQTTPQDVLGSLDNTWKQ